MSWLSVLKNTQQTIGAEALTGAAISRRSAGTFSPGGEVRTLTLRLVSLTWPMQAAAYCS